ncbi:MAG TPA: hypothetical protein VFC47_01390 [Caulobacteraceae bacterium]|nr:hypothetical protein [Caulobacteraceae bacterium]
MADTDRRERHPGMMGDGTEEQNLGQAGEPSARIDREEVEAAFDKGEGPQARDARPLAEDKLHDHLAEREKHAEDRQEALIDESVEESFPASDPPSPKHIT